MRVTKNKRFQRNVKRLWAGMIALAMILTMLPPVTAAAETGQTLYSYEGYDVAYQITGTWDTGQNVEVKVTNTSDASIVNWALNFDVGSKIVNIWNATIVESRDTEYVVKNNGWNYEIAPKQSISFGFTLAEGGTAVPKSIELCSERVAVTSGYEVTLNTINKWNNGVQAEIVVRNTSDKPFDAWTLEFDSNFTIEAYWGAKKLETTEKDYGFASEVWTNSIPAGGSTIIGFTASADKDIEISNFSLTEVVIGAPATTPAEDIPVMQLLNEEDLSINEYNTDFQISLAVEATNDVKLYLEQEESAYSGFLSDNRAIVGLPIYLNYEAGTIYSGSITFRLEEEFITNNPHFYPELGLGIERYGVFCYDESIGTIVPLPCDYDNENNSIIVDAKYMGNLLLLDYESLMYDLGIEPEASAYTMRRTLMAEPADAELSEEPSCSNEITDFEDISLEEIEYILAGEAGRTTYSLRTADTQTLKSASDSKVMRQVDLVLAVDTTGSMGGQIATVKRNLSELIRKLREDGISLYVSVVDYRDITCDGIDSTKVNNNSGVDFYNALTDISAAISSLTPAGGGDGPETAIDALGAAYHLGYRDTASKFIFLITDANYKTNNNYGITSLAQITSDLKSKGIITSVVTYTSNNRYYSNLTESTGGELISMSGDFCDAMYKVIGTKTPDSFVVIASNLVTGSFKEPLVYGGTCDTDGDSLSDSAEVDWKYVKSINKEDGTFTLYTWKELCKKGGIFSSTYDGGEKNPLFEALADVLVIPATSNPFSADTDKDYYPDNADSNKLTRDSMYIDDANIDDSEFHAGKIITEKVCTKYTDGKLSIDQAAQTANYTFFRRANERAYFTLTPQRDAYYRIVTDKATNSLTSSQIKVTYKKGLIWKQKATVSPEADGTYLLEKGTEYTIETIGYNRTARDYSVTVSQDNWIKAENGGKWTVVEYGNPLSASSTVNERMFISPELLIQATCKVLPDIDGGSYTIYKCYTKEQVDAVMAHVMYDDPESEDEFWEAVGDISTAGGMLLLVASTIPAVRESVVLYSIVTYGGSAMTTTGFAAWVASQLDHLEMMRLKQVLEEGNLAITNSRIPSAPGNIWDVWTTAPYVNKFQMSNRGEFTDITVEDVLTYCDWRN